MRAGEGGRGARGLGGRRDYFGWRFLAGLSDPDRTRLESICTEGMEVVLRALSCSCTIKSTTEGQGGCGVQRVERGQEMAVGDRVGEGTREHYAQGPHDPLLPSLSPARTRAYTYSRPQDQLQVGGFLGSCTCPRSCWPPPPAMHRAAVAAGRASRAPKGSDMSRQRGRGSRMKALALRARLPAASPDPEEGVVGCDVVWCGVVT
jgi:hypothetical protein